MLVCFAQWIGSFLGGGGGGWRRGRLLLEIPRYFTMIFPCTSLIFLVLLKFRDFGEILGFDLAILTGKYGKGH